MSVFHAGQWPCDLRATRRKSLRPGLACFGADSENAEREPGHSVPDDSDRHETRGASGGPVAALGVWVTPWQAPSQGGPAPLAPVESSHHLFKDAFRSPSCCSSTRTFKAATGPHGHKRPHWNTPLCPWIRPLDCPLSITRRSSIARSREKRNPLSGDALFRLLRLLCNPSTQSGVWATRRDENDSQARYLSGCFSEAGQALPTTIDLQYVQTGNKLKPWASTSSRKRTRVLKPQHAVSV